VDSDDDFVMRSAALVAGPVDMPTRLLELRRKAVLSRDLVAERCARDVERMLV